MAHRYKTFYTGKLNWNQDDSHLNGRSLKVEGRNEYEDEQHAASEKHVRLWLVRIAHRWHSNEEGVLLFLGLGQQ